MEIPTNKQLVCITGSVWNGSRRAPRRLLVANGFVRPLWFTTGNLINDAGYRHLSETEFHLQNAKQKVIAYIKFGGDFIGILKQELDAALRESEQGALVVGPQEIAAQLFDALPATVVFTMKEERMEVSPVLDRVDQQGKLHRIDVDALQPGAWNEAYRQICQVLGIAVQQRPF